MKRRMSKIQNQRVHLQILKSQKINLKKLQREIFQNKKVKKLRMIKFKRKMLNKKLLRLFKNKQILIIVMILIQF